MRCCCGHNSRAAASAGASCSARSAPSVQAAPPAARLLQWDPLAQASRRALLRRPRSASASADSAGAPSDSATAAAATTPAPPALSTFDSDSAALPENFCIIESRDAVKDFANLQLDELQANIAARRNRIFLLMEEVRRLRIQQRLKGGAAAASDPDAAVEAEQESYLSALPFAPPLTADSLNTYYTAYAAFVAAAILFGAVLAPLLEVRMGVGGTSYLDFVTLMHLPTQLARVDPIVASFCGGAVGVVSALLVVEVGNVNRQQANRCHYCEGAGYLACGNCAGRGVEPGGAACACCAGTGKVMCTGCLCTGKQMATEHDPRIDPFQ